MHIFTQRINHMKTYLYRKQITQTCKQYIQSSILKWFHLFNSIIDPGDSQRRWDSKNEASCHRPWWPKALASCRILEHGTWDNDALRGAWNPNQLKNLIVNMGIFTNFGGWSLKTCKHVRNHHLAKCRRRIEKGCHQKNNLPNQPLRELGHLFQSWQK